MVEALISKLNTRFLANHIMACLDIIFPQFWLQDNVDSNFSTHIVILKSALYQPNLVIDVRSDGVQVPNLLRASALDEEMAMFKMAMKSKSKLVFQPLFIVNPMTKLWQILGSNTLLVHSFLEYFKIVKMAMTIVLGFVEDERAFFTIGFVKGKLKNKLGDYLPMCV